MLKIMIPNLDSFSGRRLKIALGFAYFSEAPKLGHSRDIPIHLVCTKNSGSAQSRLGTKMQLLEGIFSSDCIPFFGASLYFDQFVIYGPDFDIDRTPSIDSWRPLSYQFENQISDFPENFSRKVGSIIGYERTFALFMDEHGAFAACDPSSGVLWRLNVASMEQLLVAYEKYVFGEPNFDNDELIDELHSSLIDRLSI